MRLVSYSRPHRAALWQAAAFSVLNKVFDLAPPYLIGMCVDIVVRREDSWLASWGVVDLRAQFVALTILTAVAWILESVCQYVQQVGWRNLAQTVQHELRIDAYRRVQDLDMAWFEDESTGSLMAVLNDDVNQLERFLDHGANEVIQTVTTAIVITATFFLMAPEVAWLAMMPIPVVLWGSFWYQSRLTPRYDAVRGQVGEVNHLLANNLSGMATIKAFTREGHEVGRMERASDRYREVNRGAIRLSSAFTPLIRMVILVGFTATLVIGGWRALDGTLSIASFIVMAFLTQRLLWPMTRLGETFDLYQRAMASTKRVLDLLDREARVKGGSVRLVPRGTRGDVRFEQVSFRYGEGRPDVLRELDLTIEAGRTTAVVGATGSGKSTLVKLLLRFYDPTAGRILLDGQDLRTLDLGDLRRAHGLVSQDVYLFHGTVRDNIAYGRLEATQEEIEAAARAVEAHDFIVALPDGYNTVVGERGQKLSGGQRQRVSLARAVLADPPILLLDEATSSVDNETEASIQRALDRVGQGRTTIAIAHRLSTVRNAHRIYVLEQGRLVESGRHEDLVARGGVYAGLWRVQTGERQLLVPPVES